MRVIFDLDGTLANAEHRVHHLTGEVKDWRAFYAKCAKDELVQPMADVLAALYMMGAEIHIWTGRSEEVEIETLEWLDRHDIEADVKMRPASDHRPDTELKAQWLAECGWKPDIVFEDRASVVEMWRSHGIVCCQVAPGDF
jgi:phosphoglycolate phosphatase-like HAD superfamily hydrolase